MARLGGDEFAIVQVPVGQPLDITALATRLIEVVGAPYDLDGHQVVVGESIGIAIAESNVPDVLMKNADLALLGRSVNAQTALRTCTYSQIILLLIPAADCATATLVLRGANSPADSAIYMVGRGIFGALTMLFCSAEKCALCLLVAGSAECYRRQARKCIFLSKRVHRYGVSRVLNDLSRTFVGNAVEVEKENARWGFLQQQVESTEQK